MSCVKPFGGLAYSGPVFTSDSRRKSRQPLSEQHVCGIPHSGQGSWDWLSPGRWQRVLPRTCHLTGLKDPDHAKTDPLAGPIFETAVLAEVVKSLLSRGAEPQIYFWRTSSGQEVDFVVDTGTTLVPLEIKLSATPRPAMAAGISTLREALGPKVAAGYVIHPGDVRLPLAPHVTALPFAKL